jgi:hypothetical protein
MGRVSAEGHLEVPVVTLDSLVFEQGYPAPRSLKLDIEGGEAAALAGASRLLAECRPVVLLATHGQRAHAACCALLRELGYQVDGLDGAPADHTDELLARPRGIPP